MEHELIIREFRTWIGRREFGSPSLRDVYADCIHKLLQGRGRAPDLADVLTFHRQLPAHKRMTFRTAWRQYALFLDQVLGIKHPLQNITVKGEQP